MTDEQILKKAIEKAVKNGYKLPSYFTVPWDSETKLEFCKLWIKNEDYIKITLSRDFVKAFWGKKSKTLSCDHGTHEIYVWQFHLQQLVLVENKIKYLKQFLND